MRSTRQIALPLPLDGRGRIGLHDLGVVLEDVASLLDFLGRRVGVELVLLDLPLDRLDRVAERSGDLVDLGLGDVAQVRDLEALLARLDQLVECLIDFDRDLDPRGLDVEVLELQVPRDLVVLQRLVSDGLRHG